MCPQGRPTGAGDRGCLAAITGVATWGCAWWQLRAVFGPAWLTVYGCFAQWSRNGVWAGFDRVLLDGLGPRGELAWLRCAVDSVPRGRNRVRPTGARTD
ncbi:transposase [Streptomyces nigra]|uniref:transposase n=1 Tax=Streptomyces nigra TaxID=1827580 RepID=UPI0037D68EA0